MFTRDHNLTFPVAPVPVIPVTVFTVAVPDTFDDKSAELNLKLLRPTWILNEEPDTTSVPRAEVAAIPVSANRAPSFQPLSP